MTESTPYVTSPQYRVLYMGYNILIQSSTTPKAEAPINGGAFIRARNQNCGVYELVERVSSAANRAWTSTTAGRNQFPTVYHFYICHMPYSLFLFFSVTTPTANYFDMLYKKIQYAAL